MLPRLPPPRARRVATAASPIPLPARAHTLRQQTQNRSTHKRNARHIKAVPHHLKRLGREEKGPSRTAVPIVRPLIIDEAVEAARLVLDGLVIEIRPLVPQTRWESLATHRNQRRRGTRSKRSRIVERLCIEDSREGTCDNAQHNSTATRCIPGRLQTTHDGGHRVTFGRIQPDLSELMLNMIGFSLKKVAE